MGETSARAAFLGAGVLIATKIGSWRTKLGVTVGTVGGASLLNAVGSATNPMFELSFMWHIVLGGWALANSGVGAAGWATAEEPWVRSFHAMNAGWNVVNLAIAGFGFFGALGETPETYDVWETIRRSENIERALMVNAALDVAYVAGGAYLTLRGDRDRDPQLLGLGRSVMLQGAFLFTFDVVVYAVHAIGNARFTRALEKLPVRFGP